MPGPLDSLPASDGGAGTDPLLQGWHRGQGPVQPRAEVRPGCQVPVTHVALLDREGNVVSVNSAWRAFAALNPGAVLLAPGPGTSYLDACQAAAVGGDETAREVLFGVGAVLAGSQPLFMMEYEQAGFAPGMSQWFVVEVSPLEGADGGIMIVHQEVTERRMFEQSVAHFALRYWTVTEQSSDYAYEIRIAADGELTIEWITEAFSRVTGYAMDELRSRTDWRRLFHPADLPGVRQHLKRLQEGETDTAEFRIVTQDGEVRWLRNQARPVWDGWAARVVAIDGAAQDVTEQKRTEEDLDRHRHRLQALFDHTLDVILLVNDEGGFVDANPAACAFLGYHRDEMLGLCVWDLTSPERADAMREAWEALVVVGQQRGDGVVRRRDGTLVEAEYRAVAHILPGLHLYVWRDVTERNRAAAALRAREERFRALVQNAGDLISVLDVDGSLQYVSPAVERVLGYRPADIIGTMTLERVHPDDLERVRKVFRQVLRGEVLEGKIEYRQRHADGHYVHLESTGVNLLGNPSVRGIVLNTRDVSDRKQADQALRESEERWRLLVDNHPEAILVSVGGRIVFVNRAGAKLAGRVSFESVLGRPLADFVSAEDVGLFERWRRAIERGEMVSPAEYTLIRLDGEERRMEAMAVPVTYNGRRAVQIVLRDVTERRRYEEGLIAARDEAERVARLRATILSNMSHEIRTPLTTVLGFAEVLVEELTGEQRELAQLIERGGQRLSQTLNSVLDLARLEAGVLPLHPETLDVVVKVRETIETFRPLLAEGNVRLCVVTAEEPIRAHLDVGVLSRVLGHLLGNALKFTEHGTVTVRLDANEERVRLQVQDTGIGISPEFMPHLFDEFEQESTGLARSYEGSGLGLTITKRLIDLVGGTIEVESEKGEGSSFTVQLPRYMALSSRSAA